MSYSPTPCCELIARSSAVHAGANSGTSHVVRFVVEAAGQSLSDANHTSPIFEHHPRGDRCIRRHARAAEPITTRPTHAHQPYRTLQRGAVGSCTVGARLSTRTLRTPSSSTLRTLESSASCHVTTEPQPPRHQIRDGCVHTRDSRGRSSAT